LRFNASQQAVAGTKKELGNRVWLYSHSLGNRLHTFTAKIAPLNRITLAVGVGQFFKTLLQVALTSLNRSFSLFLPLHQGLNQLIGKRNLFASPTRLVAMLQHLIVSHLEGLGPQIGTGLKLFRLFPQHLVGILKDILNFGPSAGEGTDQTK